MGLLIVAIVLALLVYGIAGDDMFAGILVFVLVYYGTIPFLEYLIELMN